MEATKQLCVDLVYSRYPSEEFETVFDKFEAVMNELSLLYEIGDEITQKMPNATKLQKLTEIIDSMLLRDGTFRWANVLLAIIWARRLAHSDMESAVYLSDMVGPWIHNHGGIDKVISVMNSIVMESDE